MSIRIVHEIEKNGNLYTTLTRLAIAIERLSLTEQVKRLVDAVLSGDQQAIDELAEQLKAQTDALENALPITGEKENDNG